MEHKRIIDDVKYTQYVDGKALPKENFTARYEGKTCFNMEGHAAFLTLDDAKTLVNRYIGESGQPFIEFRILHGENPTGATYAYAIMPYADNESAIEYLKNPEVEILSNTAAVQAVKKSALGISAYVFYEGASIDGITVSAPAILTKTERDGEATLRVCDPTHKLKSLVITLIGERAVKAAHDRYKISSNDGNTVIELDLEASYGEAYEIKF